MPLFNGRGLGWRPDVPDQRDLKYGVVYPQALLPPKVDLRPMDGPIWSQGQLGSCTAFAIAGVLVFNQLKQKTKVFTPSHLFIYYNEREMDGTVEMDAGAQLRDGIKSVAKIGYSEEVYWPYDISKFNIKPPVEAYQDAEHHKALNYLRLDNTNLHSLKTCLASGFPFVFGSMLYDNYGKADSNGGFVPMPSFFSRAVGGHAMACVGYDDSLEHFIIRNSWGDIVGDKGYYYMPYAYLTSLNLSDDFWTIRQVSIGHEDDHDKAGK